MATLCFMAAIVLGIPFLGSEGQGVAGTHRASGWTLGGLSCALEKGFHSSPTLLDTIPFQD